MNNSELAKMTLQALRERQPRCHLPENRRVDNQSLHRLIDEVFLQIDQIWEPGLLNWMKNLHPDVFHRMIDLEGRINASALDNDQRKLESFLREYKELVLEMLRLYGQDSFQS